MDTLTSEASWKSRQMTLPGIDSATSSPASVDGPTLCVWPDGLTTAPSGQDHAHASHSASPESARGMATSAISGLNSCASSRSASLQASLESRLRARLEGRGSPLYALTWKRWDMPSGGAIFALRALAHRRSGSACSGWQTPTTRDGKGQSGKGNRIKRGRNGRLHVANLCDQIVDLGRPDLVRSTQFRCWLMGYPESWEVARGMEMPSFRRSPRK